MRRQLQVFQSYKDNENRDDFKYSNLIQIMKIEMASSIPIKY